MAVWNLKEMKIDLSKKTKKGQQKHVDFFLCYVIIKKEKTKERKEFYGRIQ